MELDEVPGIRVLVDTAKEGLDANPDMHSLARQASCVLR